MVKKFIIPIVITVISISGFIHSKALLIFFNKPQTQTLVSNPSPTSTPAQEINIKAKFTIITGNITRSFTAEKYHNQSAEVFLTADNPTIINVKKTGITYDDFFKTLPMKLTSDCLTTGDGETLCNGKNGTLKFFLNDIDTPDLLNKEIKENDQILIKFTSP